MCIARDQAVMIGVMKEIAVSFFWCILLCLAMHLISLCNIQSSQEVIADRVNQFLQCIQLQHTTAEELKWINKVSDKWLIYICNFALKWLWYLTVHCILLYCKANYYTNTFAIQILLQCKFIFINDDSIQIIICKSNIYCLFSYLIEVYGCILLSQKGCVLWCLCGYYGIAWCGWAGKVARMPCVLGETCLPTLDREVK